MGTKSDDLSDFLDTLSVFWLCWPDRYNRNTGTAEEVETALFEDWHVFKAHLTRDVAQAEAFEVKLVEGVNLHKTGQDREGALLLQREFSNNPELWKLQ